MTQEQQILIVGSMAFDDLEMPQGTYRNVVGGAAVYSALAASVFAKVRLVGVVGADFPESQLAAFRERGVDTDGVERALGSTFRWHGRYSEDLSSRTTLDTKLNVFADFRPKIPAAYANSPLVLLGNIHPRLQCDVLGQIERPKLVAADTMNFWISGEPAALSELMSKIDLLVINDEEARELSGIHNISRAAAEIRKRGPRMLIVKRGEYGALLFDDAGAFFVPAYPLDEVIDPTGAGDSFAGGLFGYLSQAKEINATTLRRAMFYAAAMGSFCVEGIGTSQLATIRREDVTRRIESFTALVNYGGDLSLSR